VSHETAVTGANVHANGHNRCVVVVENRKIRIVRTFSNLVPRTFGQKLEWVTGFRLSRFHVHTRTTSCAPALIKPLTAALTSSPKERRAIAYRSLPTVTPLGHIREAFHVINKKDLRAT